MRYQKQKQGKSDRYPRQPVRQGRNIQRRIRRSKKGLKLKELKRNQDEKSENTIKTIPEQNYIESQNTLYCIARRHGSITFDGGLNQLEDSLKSTVFDVIGEMDMQKYLDGYVKNLSRNRLLLVCNKKTAAALIYNDVQKTTLIPGKISIQEIKDEALVEISIEDMETTWATSAKSGIKEISRKFQGR